MALGVNGPLTCAYATFPQVSAMTTKRQIRVGFLAFRRVVRGHAVPCLPLLVNESDCSPASLNAGTDMDRRGSSLIRPPGRKYIGCAVD